MRDWVTELKATLKSHNIQCVGKRKMYYPADAGGPPYFIGKGTGEPCGKCVNCVGEGIEK